VNRGGCWIDFAEFARSATRMSDAPDHRDDSIGFRVALPVAGDPR
jgi:formylglycine-generating enzyme required for sulfatase activity